MKRRSALLGIVAALAGCGGGGDGGSVADSPQPSAPPAPPAPPAQNQVPPPEPQPAPAVTEPSTQPPAPAQEPAPAPVTLSANIACWGDSLTRNMEPHLAALYPARTVFNGGVSSQTSGQIAARALADSTRTRWVTIFWYGRNNFTEPAQVIADVDASVAHLDADNDRFVVLPVLNGSDTSMGNEKRGGAGYKLIMQINNALAAKYAGNFLDLRAFLVAQADPSLPQDVIDQQNDIVPASLRTDVVHLTPRGYDLATAEIKRFLDAKGW